MKKYVGLLSLLLILLLSSCSSPIEDQVTINYPDVYYVEGPYDYYDSYQEYNEYTAEDLVTFENDSVEFKVFVFTDEDLQSEIYTSTYGYSINTSTDVEVLIDCEETLLDVEFKPDSSINYTNIITNSRFEKNCEENDLVHVALSASDQIYYTTSFSYENNRVVSPEVSNILTPARFDTTIYAYVILGAIILVSLIVMAYRVYYNYRINKQLKVFENRKVFLLDLWVIIAITSVTIVIVALTSVVLARREFNNTNFSNIHLTPTSNFEYEFDIENIVIEGVELRYINEELVTWYNKGTDIKYIELDIADQINIELVKEISGVGLDNSLCNIDNQHACVVFGPLYSFYIHLSDGENELTLAFELDEFNNVTHVALMLEHATLTTVSGLNDDVNDLVDLIESELDDYLVSLE